MEEKKTVQRGGNWTEEEKFKVIFQIMQSHIPKIEWARVDLPPGRDMKSVQNMVDAEKRKRGVAKTAPMTPASASSAGGTDKVGNQTPTKPGRKRKEGGEEDGSEKPKRKRATKVKAAAEAAPEAEAEDTPTKAGGNAGETEKPKPKGATKAKAATEATPEIKLEGTPTKVDGNAGEVEKFKLKAAGEEDGSEKPKVKRATKIKAADAEAASEAKPKNTPTKADGKAGEVDKPKGKRTTKAKATAEAAAPEVEAEDTPIKADDNAGEDEDNMTSPQAEDMDGPEA